MKKKILLIIVALFIVLFALDKLEAKVICKYEPTPFEESLSIIYDTPKSFPIVIIDGVENEKSASYLEFSSNCPDVIYFHPITKTIHLENPYMDRTALKLISKNKVYCSNITDIPMKIPELTSMIFNIVQVAVPVILVIMGSIDLFKGITSGKEDEMKKGRQMFIKRLIVGVVIFFIVIIVKFVISVVAEAGLNGTAIVDCIDCFVSNNCGV